MATVLTLPVQGMSCSGCENAVTRVVSAMAGVMSVTASHVDAQVVVFLYRLSDLLFAMARYANHKAGVKDVPWVAPQNP